jgi:hypothetical protein
VIKKGMDSLFKQKLLSLRKPPVPTTFGEALLGDTSWIKRAQIPAVTAKPVQVEYSEKVQVIESLERFAQEKSVELQSQILKLDGGELHIRPEPS